MDCIENLWLSLRQLLHELLRKVRVLNHSLSNQWELRIIHQCLDCLLDIRGKIELSHSSTSSTCFIFRSIFFFFSCHVCCRWNLSTHQEFKCYIWTVVCCCQCLKTKLSWLTRNRHQFIHGCLNFWRQLLLGNWLCLCLCCRCCSCSSSRCISSTCWWLYWCSC